MIKTLNLVLEAKETRDALNCIIGEVGERVGFQVIFGDVGLRF